MRQQYEIVIGTVVFAGGGIPAVPTLIGAQGNSTTVGPLQQLWITDVNTTNANVFIFNSSTSTNPSFLVVNSAANFCTAGKGFPVQTGQVPFMFASAGSSTSFLGYFEPKLNQIAKN